MMISDRQAQLALDHLRRTRVARRVRQAGDRADITPELLDRIVAAVMEAPDLRKDRLDAACEIVEGRVPAMRMAEKMIGRLISDELI
jgi:hypothetical protein